MKEAEVKKRMDEVLKKYSLYWLNPATGGYGESGHPDKIICVRAIMVGAEAKGKGGKVSALQVRQLRRIWDNGGIACVIGPDELKTFEDMITELAVSVPTDMAHAVAREMADQTLRKWKVI